MMKRATRILFLFPMLFVFLSARTPQTKNAREIFDSMLHACDELKSARYTLTKTERLKTGEMMNSQILVKLQVQPFKTYAFSVKPNPGAEALYVPNENGGKVLVKPNKFPYVNLSVSPDNFILREHEHHSMREIGFTYISSILKNIRQKDPEMFYKQITLDDDIDFVQKKHFQISLKNQGFTYTTYTIKKGESLMDIARRMDISEYMLLCINPSLKEYDDARTGQSIRVPTSYAKQIIFIIDKNTMLPVVQNVFDEKGLYEKYECTSFVLNPEFASNEFKPDFKDYGF